MASMSSMRLPNYPVSNPFKMAANKSLRNRDVTMTSQMEQRGSNDGMEFNIGVRVRLRLRLRVTPAFGGCWA